MRTLILNLDGTPIGTAKWQHAVSMVLRESVNVVSYYDKWCRSPSLELRIPSVVSLRSYVKPSKVQLNKRNIFLRDNNRCQYCGISESEMSIDHIIPRSRGGDNTWHNLVVACHTCNRLKADRTPEECGMVLEKIPVPPTRLMYRIKSGGQWEKYCE